MITMADTYSIYVEYYSTDHPGYPAHERVTKDQLEQGLGAYLRDMTTTGSAITKITIEKVRDERDD